MLSGSGRTLLNLLSAMRGGRLHAEVGLVVASRECAGAEHARAAGIETVVMPGAVPAAALGSLLREHAIDWVVCAGYLSYLNVPQEYAGKVVNIHPALLPAFGGKGMYGRRVHEAVLRAGAAESGCTVHLVDEVYDHGKILLRMTCPVLPGDTPETLAERVFALECRAYPEALQQLIAPGV